MTPYGYKIVDGRAMVDTLAAEKLKRFFETFLSGSPMSAAAKEAGLPICPSLYPALFYKAVYTGDDFYPGIITPEYQAQLLAEYERRRASSNQGCHRKPRKSVPISISFRLRYPAPVDETDPIQSLYGRIKPTCHPSHTR